MDPIANDPKSRTNQGVPKASQLFSLTIRAIYDCIPVTTKVSMGETHLTTVLYWQLLCSYITSAMRFFLQIIIFCFLHILLNCRLRLSLTKQ